MTTPERDRRGNIETEGEWEYFPSDAPGTAEFDAKVAALVAERRARADKYEAELRAHESFPDLWGSVIGMIRGVEYQAGGDDAAFRNEVVAILDASERITLERLAERRAQP